MGYLLLEEHLSHGCVKRNRDIFKGHLLLGFCKMMTIFFVKLFSTDGFIHRLYILLNFYFVSWLGSEVAQYVAKHFPEVLKRMGTYKKGEIKQSMIDSFLEMDQQIISEEVG